MAVSVAVASEWKYFLLQGKRELRKLREFTRLKDVPNATQDPYINRDDPWREETF